MIAGHLCFASFIALRRFAVFSDEFLAYINGIVNGTLDAAAVPLLPLTDGYMLRLVRRLMRGTPTAAQPRVRLAWMARPLANIALPPYI